MITTGGEAVTLRLNVWTVTSAKDVNPPVCIFLWRLRLELCVNRI